MCGVTAGNFEAASGPLPPFRLRPRIVDGGGGGGRSRFARLPSLSPEPPEPPPPD